MKRCIIERADLAALDHRPEMISQGIPKRIARACLNLAEKANFDGLSLGALTQIVLDTVTACLNNKVVHNSSKGGRFTARVHQRRRQQYAAVFTN